MVDCRVFEKIERYIKTIDTNTDDKITQQELEKAGETNKIPSIWMQRIEDIANGNDISTDKIYTRQTGYIGNMKSVAAKDMDPYDMLMHAVKGMLPKNSLGRQMLKKLRIYKGAEHEQTAQKPEVYEF